MSLTKKQKYEIERLTEEKRREYWHSREDYAFRHIKHVFENKVHPSHSFNLIKNNNTFGHYDYEMNVFKNDGTLTKKMRILFEVKVRNDDYEDGLILEQKKYNNLLEEEKRLEKEYGEYPKNKIFYICFTPEKTIFFDIKNTKLKFYKDSVEFKGSQIDNTKNSKKSRCLLKEFMGKTIDFKFDYDYFHEYFFGRVEKKRFEEKKKERCIFAQLKNNDKKDEL